MKKKALLLACLTFVGLAAVDCFAQPRGRGGRGRGGMGRGFRGGRRGRGRGWRGRGWRGRGWRGRRWWGQPGFGVSIGVGRPYGRGYYRDYYRDRAGEYFWEITNNTPYPIGVRNRAGQEIRIEPGNTQSLDHPNCFYFTVLTPKGERTFRTRYHFINVELIDGDLTITKG